MNNFIHLWVLNVKTHLGDLLPSILTRDVLSWCMHEHTCSCTLTHLRTCACSTHTRTIFTVMQKHKSTQLLPQSQLSRSHKGKSRVFLRSRFLCHWTKGISFLLSPLNPIMCHHLSPTRLFPSYRQRRLPISLNCLLCKVTAVEHRWERAVLAFSCSSLTATSPKHRDSTWEAYCTPLGNYTVGLT